MEKKTESSELLIYVLVIIGVIFIFVKTYTFFNNKISRINCESNITILEKSAERFITYRADKIANEEGYLDIPLLIRGRFLTMHLKCPQKGFYKVNAAARVYCTEHGRPRGGR